MAVSIPIWRKRTDMIVARSIHGQSTALIGRKLTVGIASLDRHPDRGNFPPLFNPSEILEAPWGGITATFATCDSGTIDWLTNAEGFQSGSMPLTRLTSLWVNDCL